MIFLALGSNLSSSFGNRYQNLELATSYLEKKNIKVLKKSSYYESQSYPDITHPKYINMVISIQCNLSLLHLMEILISAELQLERKRKKKNDPRTCDIDIIDFNKQVITHKKNQLLITVPHDKLDKRNFVLFPLREICPEWKHPKTNENIDNLINKLPIDEINSILKIIKD